MPTAVILFIAAAGPSVRTGFRRDACVALC
jgi:hypothetical protein